MSMSDTIAEKLTQAFSPQSLNIVNESHLHAGHGDHVLSGESHFRVHIVSDAFKGKSRIERHRMINTLLAAELRDHVHALAIHANTPDEAVR
jgi:BolA protein